MGYGGFEMGFFWYAGYEFQKVGGKSGMRDWALVYGEYDMKSQKIVNGGWESDFHL